MKAHIGHIGINLSNTGESFRLWKDLFKYLEFKIIEEDTHFDAGDGRSYFCVSATEKDHRKNSYHRKNTGLNHVAFGVSSGNLVDQFVSEFLTPKKITPLYGGAKMYPEYAKGYYAVYFEDPDRIKIEVAYDPSLLLFEK